jgi:hypothetical protein
MVYIGLMRLCRRNVHMPGIGGERDVCGDGECGSGIDRIWEGRDGMYGVGRIG